MMGTGPWWTVESVRHLTGTKQAQFLLNFSDCAFADFEDNYI